MLAGEEVAMRFPTGGDLLVECLLNHGISHVFSIIGGQMGTIYDAVGRSPDIEVVTPRSETSAALMACGYTAASGRPCVSMATVGAGVVYEVAGLAKAWFDYLPVISIAPQVQSYRVKPHQESLQACEQDELFGPITKWNTIVYHWGRIPQMIDRAFREALAGAPGPVHVDIPVDVLFRRSPLTEGRRRRLLVEPGRSRYCGPVRGDAAAVAKAAEALRSAGTPLVVVGQGFGRAGRCPGIGAILEEAGIPVVTTNHSAGIMPPGSACYAGDLAVCAGLEQFEKTDLLLLIGIDRHSKGVLAGLEGARTIIQVETDPGAFITGTADHHAVHADPESALAAMRGALDARASDAWRGEFVAAAREAAKAAVEGSPAAGRIARVLGEASSGNAVIVADGEAPSAAARALLTGADYKAVFIMDERDIRGAGLPFALGAWRADPSNNVILACDKNSLFYHVRELQPAACEMTGIRAVCLDESDPRANVADTASVLTGLGCEVARREAGEDGDLPECPAGVPSAILLG